MTRWADIDQTLRETAEAVLTDKQLDVVKLSLDGAGTGRIARALGISRSAARDRLDNAYRKLADHLDPELVQRLLRSNQETDAA